MQHIPPETVTAWIDQKKKLDPRRLIPALVHYHQQGKSTQVHKDKGEDIFLNLSYISQSKSVRVAENIIENATPNLKDTLEKTTTKLSRGKRSTCVFHFQCKTLKRLLIQQRQLSLKKQLQCYLLAYASRTLIRT